MSSAAQRVTVLASMASEASLPMARASLCTGALTLTARDGRITAVTIDAVSFDLERASEVKRLMLRNAVDLADTIEKWNEFMDAICADAVLNEQASEDAERIIHDALDARFARKLRASMKGVCDSALHIADTLV